MIYVTKDKYDYYWVLDDDKGGRSSAETVAEAFASFTYEPFQFAGSNNYYHKGSFIMFNDQVSSNILVTIPDGTSYEEFINLHPEFLV